VSRQGRRSLRPENADECCASAAWSNDSPAYLAIRALGRYLAGTRRQFSADLNGEVQVRMVAGHLLQASGDERGGLGNVIAALGESRAQEVEFRPGGRRAGGEPVQQVVLGGSREPVEEHLMPRGEVARSFLAPVTGLIEGSVCGARPLWIDASSRLQRLQVGLGELPPQDCGVEGDLQVVLSVRGDGYPRWPPGARIACMRESAWPAHRGGR